MIDLWSITLWYVIAGTVLVAASASCVGVFTLLQKKPLAGDAVAHALLPGLCIGFMLVGKKSLLALFIGSFIAGMCAFMLIDEIPRRSKLKKDTATAFVLSFFFGVGLLLLKHIQHSGNAQQAGLQQFLFGNAASIQRQDIMMFIGVALILLIVLSLFFRAFKVFIFDRSFAYAMGWPVRKLDFLLRALVVIAVVVGIQSVGLLLMTAMLVAPAAAARFWSNRLYRILCISVFFASLSAMCGTLVSYKVLRLPTGPCIVLVMAFVALISFLGAPKKGMVARWWAQRCYRKKVLRENILKLFYTLGEEEEAMFAVRPITQLLMHYSLRKDMMQYGLKQLVKQRLLDKRGEAGWVLTKKGRRAGEEIQRLHLLWEAYLMRYLRVAPDHVHEDAESIEHLLTPGLRKELETLLDDNLAVADQENVKN